MEYGINSINPQKCGDFPGLPKVNFGLSPAGPYQGHFGHDHRQSAALDLETSDHGTPTGSPRGHSADLFGQ